jgi:hypothetical protein
MHSKEVIVMLTGVGSEMIQVMANVGILEQVGSGNVFREESDIWASTIEAMKKAYTILGNQRCAHCQHQFLSLSTSDWSYMI